MSSIPPLGKLERVPLREAWRHEASDFTPWLAEDDNLQALAEAQGISELKESDHKHPGQILAYAVGEQSHA